MVPSPRSRRNLTDTFWSDRISFAEALTQAAQMTDVALDQLLVVPLGLEARVYEAMRYAALAPGKRMRPFFVLAGANLFGVARRCALQVSAAIEMVHAYSMVHDDLPAMDDSDLRRGRPTCHKEFDEATAILAGDGLLTLAFGVLADPDSHGDSAVRCELVSALAAAAGAAGMVGGSAAAGAAGMVGGQMIDLIAERQALDIGAITRLQRMKTGALIAFSCEAGAILGKAPGDLRIALRGYAHDLGLAYQIADDLLDVEGSAAKPERQSAPTPPPARPPLSRSWELSGRGRKPSCSCARRSPSATGRRSSCTLIVLQHKEIR
jgi:farnesyl diphosphate synthase